MELLLSKIPPLCCTKRNVSSCFEDLLENADAVRIATGYVSADALIELKKIIEENKKPYLELMIGMHGFDGFTRTQYETAIVLDEFLRAKNAGGVKVSTVFKFHGKIYTFSKQTYPFAGILGSSNLNSIFDSHNIYEADLLIDEPGLVRQLDSFILDFSEKACTPINEHKPTSFVEGKNTLLDGVEGVGRVKNEEYTNVFNFKG